MLFSFILLQFLHGANIEIERKEDVVIAAIELVLKVKKQKTHKRGEWGQKKIEADSEKIE